ncbi:MAG: HAD family hydrolase [Erysipelotrichaceae bacterium]
MIKAIIFDLDGTVLDTLLDLKTAVNRVMNKLGYREQSYEEVRNKVGSGFRNLMFRCIGKEDVSEEELDKAENQMVIEYKDCYHDNTKPYEGINELLTYLKGKDIKIAINSNKKDDYTKKLIELNFPFIDPDLVLGKREGYKVKPDPANNSELMEKMKVNTDEVLYVGDSLVDIKTARNSNLKAISVSWGFVDKEKLIEAKPDYIIDKPYELIDIIETLNKE